MDINKPYNGLKCCPVCATNHETLWMALKLAMPLGAVQAPSSRSIETPNGMHEPKKRPYDMSKRRQSPSFIPLEKKEEARRLRRQGIMPEEIARITGINKNTLPKILLGVRTDPQPPAV